jgi:hypothetical protein
MKLVRFKSHEDFVYVNAEIVVSISPAPGDQSRSVIWLASAPQGGAVVDMQPADVAGVLITVPTYSESAWYEAEKLLERYRLQYPNREAA